MSQPAARLTDLHTCPLSNGPVPHVGGPIIQPGHPQTLIAGLPAARVTDFAFCVGPPDVIVKGSATVLIGGLMAARMGDTTAHGGVIAAGCPKVLIGDSGSGSGSPQGATLQAAQGEGKAFTRTNCAEAGALAAVQASPLLAAPQPNQSSWVEVELVDDVGKPVPYSRFRVTGADGKAREAFTDKSGVGRIDGIDPGSCRITFPDLDADAWRAL